MGISKNRKSPAPDHSKPVSGKAEPPEKAAPKELARPAGEERPAKEIARPAGEERPPKEFGGLSKEIGGPGGPEPTRYGDWERKGITSDF